MSLARILFHRQLFPCSLLSDLLRQQQTQSRLAIVMKSKQQQDSQPASYKPQEIETRPEKTGEESEVSKTRLSKLLSNSGVCSRREAERLISQQKVKYKGVTLDENIHLTPAQLKHVQVTTKNNSYDLIPTSRLRVWAYYKPKGLICSRDDPRGRTTIYDQIALQKKDMPEHVASVGRLDYNSEGLMLLTNNGDLARQLELPDNQIVRTYRVRVFGRLDEEKLKKIREGCMIKGVQYGPFLSCDIVNRQTRNTWLKISMVTGKNREIRKIMQRQSLRVNRIVRLAYGPYSLENLKSGEVQEATVHFKMHRLYHKGIDQKLQVKKRQMQTTVLLEQNNEQQKELPGVK